jgi:diguanylate cyclase (GGDEF)-like protein
MTMRILVVDDEPAALMLAQAVVAAAGHEVQTAVDGAQAEDLLVGSSFDVLITDAQMPGLSGFDLAERIRRTQGRYVYVIMLTGLDQDSERLAGMQAGVDDYLVKPLRPATLTSLLVAAERVVSLHRSLEDQRRALEQRATYDSLTGVFNRVRLEDDLESLLAQFRRYDRRFSLALVDVDWFKTYNDSYGHLAGDEALRTVASTIAGALRDGDTVYRFGGEEFLCLLPEQDCERALIAMQRVRRAVRAHGLTHAGSGHGVVTISVGVAESDLARHPTGEQLVDAADRALFAAKSAGRDRVCTAPTSRAEVARSG